MHATLKNNQLITPAHDGEFVVDVDGPGVYEVKTCSQWGDVIRLGVGTVEVTESDLLFTAPLEWMTIENHRVVILTVTNDAYNAVRLAAIDE